MLTKSPPADQNSDPEPKFPSPRDRGSWWSRHSTLINFWLDAALLVLFVVQGWLFAVVQFVFPRGVDQRWTIWGGTYWDWADALFAAFAAFALGVAVHVMLHWQWICAVIATKLLKRRAEKDDGRQTLLGVGLIVVLVHLIAAGVLAARVGLQHTN